MASFTVKTTTTRPKRIVIQSPSAASSAFGQSGVTYSDVAKVTTIDWTSVGGKEYLGAQQIQGQVSAQVTIRWQRSLVAVRSGYRVKLPGTGGANPTPDRFFDVAAAINQNEQNQYIVLLLNEAT